MDPTEIKKIGEDLKPHWYALYTRYQHEKTVYQILLRKEFEVFLPVYTSAHRWKDRTKFLSLPLFPSYVFIRGGLGRRLEILTTPGVFELVGTAGKASPISEEEIRTVRRVVENAERVEPHPYLASGDRIRVKSGPLAGIEGILVRKKNLSRLILSVELLQKSIAVEIEVSNVERVGGGTLRLTSKVTS